MEFRTAIFTKYVRTLYNINLDKTNQIHKVLIESLFKVFVQMEKDIDQMALEICLSTATGKWLDLWGEYFGIPRQFEEKDEKYSVRMIAEIIEPKATLNALRKGTARWLNLNLDENYKPSDIEAYEPWTDLLVTSHRGALSYMGRLPDSEYWTHGVVDIAIPDSSEMSADLIKYLNTIKAAGVQISWHTTMNWGVLKGYFDQDEVRIWIEKWYDIWVKREYDITDGMRTLSEYYGLSESYNTPISVSGYLSGRKVNRMDIDIAREFEPFRTPAKVIQSNPLITLGDIADFLGVDFESMTVEQLTQIELNADNQIPNKDYLGKSFEDEMKPFLETFIDGIIDEWYEYTVSQLISKYSSKTITQIEKEFDEDTDGLNNFLNNWRKHNYFNKPLNSNPLSICTGPLKILTESDTED